MNRDNAIETCGNCNKLVIAYTGTQAYICINPNALCICRGSSSDQLILRALEKQQAKIVKKISFMFGIPVSDLEKALQAKDYVGEVFGVNIAVDEKVPYNGVRFDHPDGRVDGYLFKGKGV